VDARASDQGLMAKWGCQLCQMCVQFVLTFVHRKWFVPRRDLSSPFVSDLESLLEQINPHYCRSSRQHNPPAVLAALSDGGALALHSYSSWAHSLNMARAGGWVGGCTATLTECGDESRPDSKMWLGWLIGLGRHAQLTCRSRPTFAGRCSHVGELTWHAVSNTDSNPAAVLLSPLPPFLAAAGVLQDLLGGFTVVRPYLAASSAHRKAFHQVSEVMGGVTSAGCVIGSRGDAQVKMHCQSWTGKWGLTVSSILTCRRDCRLCARWCGATMAQPSLAFVHVHAHRLCVCWCRIPWLQP
jgi:hypothetical protein